MYLCVCVCTFSKLFFPLFISYVSLINRSLHHWLFLFWDFYHSYPSLQHPSYSDCIISTHLLLNLQVFFYAIFSEVNFYSIILCLSSRMSISFVVLFYIYLVSLSVHSLKSLYFLDF